MNKKPEAYDYVGYRRENSDITEYGIVQKYDRTRKMYEIAPCSREKNIFLPKSELTYMPPKIITSDELKKLIRYEISCDEFFADIIPDENYKFKDYEIEYSFDDMAAMIKNVAAAKMNKEEFRSWLFMAFSDDLDFYCSDDNDMVSITEDRSPADFTASVSEYAMAAKIFDVFWTVSIEHIWQDDDIDLRTEIDIDHICRDIENFRNRQPIRSHLWSLDGKRKVCDIVKRNRTPAGLTDDEKDDIRNIVTTLAEADNPDALEALGYACYGGDDPVFECDWVRSRDCFLKLLTLDTANDLNKCYFANTLGYIFYYLSNVLCNR